MQISTCCAMTENTLQFNHHYSFVMFQVVLRVYGTAQMQSHTGVYNYKPLSWFVIGICWKN